MTSRSQSPAARPPGFVYRETKRGILRRTGPLVLHCEDVALPKLAEQYGTPLYVYSATTIRERYDAFDRRIPRPSAHDLLLRQSQFQPDHSADARP